VALIRSFLYTIFFYLGSIPLVIGAALSAIVGPPALWRASRLWAQYHYWCVRNILGIRVVVEGTFPTRDAIIAIKHEAALETIETLRLIDRPAVVMKAELFKIPVWGWVAERHGSIPVARETGSAALRRMLKAANAAMAAGRPIVIFPEGTRIPHGEAPPLRPGIAGLYKTLGVPIVPVALDSGQLWQRRRLIKRSGVVTIRIGEPIPNGLPRAEVEARVHAGINALNQS
jgi:1-acyl-sn-glycerol-3-phosphate acyltransferase